MKWGSRMDASSPKVSRRLLLKSAVAVAVTAAIAGPIAVVRSSGYVYFARSPLRALSTWQAVVVDAAAGRVLAADRPGDPTILSPHDVDVVGFVDAYVAGMPADLRRDLLRLVAYVEHVAPLACGFASRFSRLAPADQDHVLAAMQESHVDLLRGGFDALKSLLYMGYYRDPRTWAIVDYDGPWIDRPKGGWW